MESFAERLAAALFAVAVAYAFIGLFGGVYRQPQLSLFTAIAAVMSFLLCVGALGRVIPEEGRFALPEFEPHAMPDFPAIADELLLTEPAELLLTERAELVLTYADRIGPPRVQPDAEEALEAILAKLGPDSRVVRLFDPAAAPTPGQLKNRIERHLDAEKPRPSDDSQALFDALAELRRSLR